MAIFSMTIKIWSWETFLDISCDGFVYEYTLAALLKGPKTRFLEFSIVTTFFIFLKMGYYSEIITKG